MNRLMSLINMLSCTIERGTMNGASQAAMPQVTKAGNQKKIFKLGKGIMLLLIMLACISSFAQSGGEYEDHPPATYNGQGNQNTTATHNFKKENIFLGGSLQLGYAANTFSIGGNPEIGYSITQWLDAGIALNLIYSSQSADPNYIYNDDTRTREFNYGGGIFIRVYPVRFLFLELQPEENWIHENQVYYGAGTPQASPPFTLKSNSLIAGIGYAQRVVGEINFFTLIGLDLDNNPNSPYREVNFDGSTSPIPIIRAGFDIYLRPSKK